MVAILFFKIRPKFFSDKTFEGQEFKWSEPVKAILGEIEDLLKCKFDEASWNCMIFKQLAMAAILFSKMRPKFCINIPCKLDEDVFINE